KIALPDLSSRTRASMSPPLQAFPVQPTLPSVLASPGRRPRTGLLVKSPQPVRARNSAATTEEGTNVRREIIVEVSTFELESCNIGGSIIMCDGGATDAVMQVTKQP